MSAKARSHGPVTTSRLAPEANSALLVNHAAVVATATQEVVRRTDDGCSAAADPALAQTVADSPACGQLAVRGQLVCGLSLDRLSTQVKLRVSINLPSSAPGVMRYPLQIVSRHAADQPFSNGKGMARGWET